MNVAQKILEGSHENILIVQLYSMRSYEDNCYNPICDGNMNHTLHELYNLMWVYHANVKKVSITIPDNVSEHNFMLLRSIIDIIFSGTGTKYEFILCKYATNVAETRENAAKVFDKLLKNNHLSDQYDCMVCDFELVRFDKSQEPANTIYRFNVVPQVPAMQNAELHVVNAGYPVSVFNEWQLNFFEKELKTTGNVFQSRNWFNEEFVNKIANLYDGDTALSYNKFLFIPFRLTDKSYKIDEMLAYWNKNTNTKGLPIIATDPNDTAKKYKDLLQVLPMTKMHLYKFCIENKDKMVIKYECNPIETLHQTFLEFIALCPDAIQCEPRWKEYAKEAYFI